MPSFDDTTSLQVPFLSMENRTGVKGADYGAIMATPPGGDTDVSLDADS